MTKSKYKSLYEWKKADEKAYEVAWKRNLLLKICKEFGWSFPRLKSKKHTLESCKNDASTYSTRTEWSHKSHGAYSAALNNNWMNECCTHMVRMKRKDWTFDTCQQEALKYKTRTEWQNNSRGSYKKANKNGWVEECTKHMCAYRVPIGYWTLETCKQEALKYSTKNDWIKHGMPSYRFAAKNAWLEECSKHMPSFFIPTSYWTLETCKEEALNYKSKTEWKVNHNKSYEAARKNKWVSECAKHMK